MVARWAGRLRSAGCHAPRHGWASSLGAVAAEIGKGALVRNGGAMGSGTRCDGVMGGGAWCGGAMGGGTMGGAWCGGVRSRSTAG
jgi:hypothetical protein